MALALAANRGDLTRAVAQLERDGHSGIGAALNSTSESAGGVFRARSWSRSPPSLSEGGT
ncbi:hypothetical protein [Pseudooceanicola spongiae]|uniref:Uncharacterized protein n=1 Tax=Pseudooceanicola spongiae TaxID=2613965 RepID=A0A7L9WNU6_9RHOB|nr:hypothetical protein [Pseudooceanicola spongiae]QOL80770.1 hypothetical protein F3W81_08040 [Pseudooceanicola spongiae]